jgi:excisionase family DNA binding protein
MDRDNDLLTVTEAANILGLNVSRVRVFIAEGRLRAIKPGNEWLIERAELARFREIPRRPGIRLSRDEDADREAEPESDRELCPA